MLVLFFIYVTTTLKKQQTTTTNINNRLIKQGFSAYSMDMHLTDALVTEQLARTGYGMKIYGYCAQSTMTEMYHQNLMEYMTEEIIHHHHQINEMSVSDDVDEDEDVDVDVDEVNDNDNDKVDGDESVERNQDGRGDDDDDNEAAESASSNETSSYNTTTITSRATATSTFTTTRATSTSTFTVTTRASQWSVRQQLEHALSMVDAVVALQTMEIQTLDHHDYHFDPLLKHHVNVSAVHKDMHVLNFGMTHRHGDDHDDHGHHGHGHNEETSSSSPKVKLVDFNQGDRILWNATDQSPCYFGLPKGRGGLRVSEYVLSRSQ
jgi:hypothetical protein